MSENNLLHLTRQTIIKCIILLLFRLNLLSICNRVFIQLKSLFLRFLRPDLVFSSISMLHFLHYEVDIIVYSHIRNVNYFKFIASEKLS